MNKIFFILSVSTFFIVACKKETPVNNPAPAPTTTENLSKSWKLSQYLRNDTLRTDSIYISNYTETYASSAVYNRSYSNIKTKSNVVESGKWELKNENKEIHISGVSSIKDFSSTESSISSSTYYISKISSTELHYHYMNGSVKHEFRFILK